MKDETLAHRCRDRIGVHKSAEWGCLNLWKVPPTTPCGSRAEIKQAAEAQGER